ncbi:MAG: hypothetical protein RBT66_07775 [bacterium]|jgi:hypothetical protein|nr:hypothetical protein [bacterium]
MKTSDVFELPKVGRIGARRTDRLYMEYIRRRAAALHRATKISHFSTSNVVEKEEKQLRIKF